MDAKHLIIAKKFGENNLKKKRPNVFQASILKKKVQKILSKRIMYNDFFFQTHGIFKMKILLLL